MKLNQTTKIYAPAKCAWCDGAGKRNVTYGNQTSCSVCGGKGHVSIAQPVETCRQCEGSGKRGTNVLCFHCAGTGWEHVAEKG